jgi:hypothetical protein
MILPDRVILQASRASLTSRRLQGFPSTYFFIHKNMPNLILSGADSDDVIAYILGLEQQ